MFHLLHLQAWVQDIGLLGIAIILFLQNGLLLGFFFPGDSLLFTAGFLASQHFFNLPKLIVVICVVAIIGYMVAYWLGIKIGHWLLQRQDGRFFKKHYIQDAHDFYEKHGALALILGRLIPIVRTFVPVVAGMVRMPYLKYCLYNLIGGVIWGAGVTLLGYYLGEVFPQAQHYLLPAVLVIVVISLLPSIWHFMAKRKSRRGDS